jgi:hypothetical protein
MVMSLTEIKKGLNNFIKNVSLVPEDFWIRSEKHSYFVVWLLNREDGTAGSCQTSQERLGITKDGRVLWGFSSGCSCWNGWSAGDYFEPVSWKEFEIKLDNKSLGTEFKSFFTDGWDSEVLSALNDFSLLFKKSPSVQEVLGAQNAELRRYLVKRMGYDVLRKNATVKIIGFDGDSELLDVKTVSGVDRYVKVKDSSTDRVYLLNVPEFIKGCKQGIAWTFGLREEEYDPEVET